MADQQTWKSAAMQFDYRQPADMSNKERRTIISAAQEAAFKVMEDAGMKVLGGSGVNECPPGWELFDALPCEDWHPGQLPALLCAPGEANHEGRKVTFGEMETRFKSADTTDSDYPWCEYDYVTDTEWFDDADEPVELIREHVFVVDADRVTYWAPGLIVWCPTCGGETQLPDGADCPDCTDGTADVPSGLVPTEDQP